MFIVLLCCNKTFCRSFDADDSNDDDEEDEEDDDAEYFRFCDCGRVCGFLGRGVGLAEEGNWGSGVCCERDGDDVMNGEDDGDVGLESGTIVE